MNVRGNFSADFRRYVKRGLSKRERAVIELMEVQRRRYGRVRVYINDPRGELRYVLIEYLRWHQQRLTSRDAMIVTSRKTSGFNGLRGRFVAARRYDCLLGCGISVGQVLLFGSDMYCPTVPRYANYLDRVLSTVSPFLAGRDSVMIVCGDASHGGSRFRELFERHRLASGYFLVIDERTEMAGEVKLSKSQRPIRYLILSAPPDYGESKSEAPDLPNSGLRAKVA